MIAYSFRLSGWLEKPEHQARPAMAKRSVHVNCWKWDSMASAIIRLLYSGPVVETLSLSEAAYSFFNHSLANQVFKKPLCRVVGR